jgi:hypothetical protein
MVASLVISYQLRVLCHPVRYAKTEALLVEAPVFHAQSNFATFQTVKRKYWNRNKTMTLGAEEFIRWRAGKSWSFGLP